MYENDVAAAVEAWVKEVLPELAATYPHVTAAKADLPDAQVDLQNKAISYGRGDERFPYEQLQQRMLRVFDLQISFMVERGEGATPEDQLDADLKGTTELRDFGERLERDLLANATLGDRVQVASPICEFSYGLPFVEYPDGTRGRQMMFSMSVAELVDNEE
jgi:hypothetical protein